MKNPFSYQFSIQTDLTASQVSEHLKTKVAMFKGAIGYYSANRAPDRDGFYGEADGMHFRIRKNRFYKNSFSPEIHGKISSRENGSNLEIKFRARRWAIFVFLVFMGATLFMALKSFLAVETQFADAVIAAVIYLLFFAGLWKAYSWFVNNEYAEIRKEMESWFELEGPELPVPAEIGEKVRS